MNHRGDQFRSAGFERVAHSDQQFPSLFGRSLDPFRLGAVGAFDRPVDCGCVAGHRCLRRHRGGGIDRRGPDPVHPDGWVGVWRIVERRRWVGRWGREGSVLASARLTGDLPPMIERVAETSFLLRERHALRLEIKESADEVLRVGVLF